MAEVYEFGVSRSDIGRYLPRIAFSENSAPTENQADAIITDHAADLCAFLYGMGVNVANLNATPNSALYRNCQRYILLRYAAQVMRLRNQNDQTLADRLDEEASALMKRLREIPQDMGATRPVSPSSPNIMHSQADYPEQIYAKSIASRSRLAINATQDKM